MSKKTESFSVYARLDLEVSLDVRATSFEDALEQAKELQYGDFVTIKGELLDNEPLRIVGIYRPAR